MILANIIFRQLVINMTTRHSSVKKTQSYEQAVPISTTMVKLHRIYS